MYRIIDNNCMWGNIYKTKKEALKELKVQRDYDIDFRTYGLQQKIDGEWFTLKWFKEQEAQSCN